MRGLNATKETVKASGGQVEIATTVGDEGCGASNGAVSIDGVTGGTAPYTYDFNMNGFSTATTYSGLASGNYMIDVIDARGCTYSTSVTVNNTPPPTVSISYATQFCSSVTSTQSVTMTATGSSTGGTFS